MERSSLRILALALLVVSTTACSAIVAGKLSNKPASPDGGAPCTFGVACNTANICDGPGVCSPDGHCSPGDSPLPEGATCPGTAPANFCLSGVCTPNSCGDSFVGPPEQCDDGNDIDADGCRNDCTLGGGDPCADAIAGTPCEVPSGVAAVCDGSTCIESTCGDGVVDPRTEACDDANVTPGDGCEPDTCAFTCATDTDCADGNVCNGEETCQLDSHICAFGMPPTAGTACMTPEGISGECNAAQICGPAGCGNGATTAPEQCDDGNTVDGDGCDNDCTFSCTTSADCDDRDVCNGAETCDPTFHKCSPGAALFCPVADACHDAACDPAGGCFSTLIDGDGDGQASSDLPGGCGTDCNDSNPAVYAGAEELCDGIDNNCNGAIDETAPTWYVDCDGDGYSAGLAGATPGCTMPDPTLTGCPGGSVRTWTARRPADTSSTDCYDTNASVHPGQSAWFTAAASGRPTTEDFDYDCNGTEDKRYTRLEGGSATLCSNIFGRCSGLGYWTGTTIPACGVVRPYSSCGLDRLGTCIRMLDSTAVQSCH